MEEGSEVKLSSLKGKQFEKAIIDHVKKEAKTQGFFGQFLQNILGYEKEKNWFFSEVKKKKIDSFDELNKFLSDNRYFRNFQVESVNESDEDLFTTDDEDKQAAKDGEEVFKHLKKYGAKKVKNMIQFKVGKTSFAVHLK